MPSLYSTYRPKEFSELVGQTHIVRLLKAELSKGLTGHAYLFIGPRGTGKTTTARILARALNCEALKNGEPCGECHTCKAFDEGKFIDLIEIDAASNRGIDEIRELKERIEYNPAMGKQKVYIVDEVHMLTKEAFNALLKTLEEPPEYVTFILATTEPHKIPATIMSRCEKFEFRLGNQRDINTALKKIMESEGVKVDKKGLDLLVTHSGGSYRDAVSLLDTIVAATGDKELTFEEVQESLGLPDDTVVNSYILAIAEGKVSEALSTLEEVFSRGTNIPQFTKSVILTLRDCLLDKSVAEEIGEPVVAVSRARLTELIKLLLDAYSSQRLAFDHRLPLQLATVQMVQEKGDLPVVIKQEVTPKPKPEISDTVIKAETKISTSVAEQVPSEIETTSTDPEKKMVVKKKKVKKKAKEVPARNLSLDEIQADWTAFIRAVQLEHKQLYTFIMAASPSAAQFDQQVQVTKVELKVPYDFHKKQLENAKNQMVLLNAAKKIYNSPLQFICVISKEELVFKKTAPREIDDNVVAPAVQSVKVEAKSAESPLESAFDSVLGADVETLA